MICTRSRLHAVRFFQTFSRLMQEANLPFKPLVAFSGTVKDPDIDAQYTEASLNNLPGRIDIPDAFKTPDYRILIVADKYQTGFDEPLLYAMYVDKKLGGVNAVQTLSRLNRPMLGKTECVVVDFVNTAQEIQAAFQPYYQVTLLEDVPNPDDLYDLKDDILHFEIFTQQDVDELAEIFWSEPVHLERLQPILDRARDQWREREKSERDKFRSKLQSFKALYGFVSQVITFEDISLEKFYIFVKLLNRKLDPRESGKLPKELLNAVRLDSLKIERGFSDSIVLVNQDGIVEGISGSPVNISQEEQRDTLRNIVDRLNDTYGLNLTEENKIDIQRLRIKVEENTELRAVMTANNTEQIKREKFGEVMDRTFLEFVHDKLDLYKKLRAPEVNTALKYEWYEDYKERLENVYENSPDSFIDSLLRNPLKIADFQPFTREEVHERG